MNKQYIDIPIYTTYDNISSKNFSLSATQYKTFYIKNKNTITVQDFLSRNLERNDLGSEVGSDAYVESSNYFFIKTKALQSETYLLDNSKDAIQNITPMSYINTQLKKGDLLISKDSNVGEIAILDRDYPNTMLCSGIYKLPVNSKKYYLLAFIKNQIFRQQIDFLVPRGSTIRHGKTKFLECLIPLPTKNEANTVKYVEILTEAIVNKERKIIEKYNLCSEMIVNELKNNQKENSFKYSLPNINEIIKNERMDTKLYSNEYKQAVFLIENYLNGYFTIPIKKIHGGNTPKKRILSEEGDLDYFWVTPTIFSNHGLLTTKNSINCETVNIKKNSLLIVNRTSKGGEGKYVGMSYFYNINELGKGQYNQGIYGISDFSDEELYYFNALINSTIYRTIFSKLAMGSKMKEIKQKQLSQLKFPNFPQKIKNTIVGLYCNKSVEYDISKCTLESFLEYDNSFNSVAGIYELDKSKKYLQYKLEQAIAHIADNEVIETYF
jgi:type I restriction enzyme S subunit